MQKVSTVEMMEVNGGKKYEEKCKYCGLIIGTHYLGWSWISLQTAKAVVGGSRRKHEYKCMERFL